ncbi:hypothetical protein QEJ31_10080 [Pigmentibacter sp. JX0631]|uniref:hypothetical protein n=1 Tax=Pigmentibacter sp. JX0631 TaxID=2976982 RepID=UPI0024682FC4|nr:hypothetical protein [Pigmentibacter sp. JX0631]WGL58869.1 hypothetical protein QEJ31_10080 [Pigmentibacter sp. JX0631]
MYKKTNNFSNISIFNIFIPSIFLLFLFYFSFISFLEQEKYRSLQQNMSLIKVIYPDEKPSMTQENIELAMSLFSINKNEHTNYPKLVSDLNFRGLTVGESFSKNREVFIGNMAFDSWSILGSTLAHEIEIHSNQSFLQIEVFNYIDTLRRIPAILFAKSSKNKIGEDLMIGTYLAEKEAYQYEINSKDRFNLSKDEVKSIKFTLENELN